MKPAAFQQTLPANLAAAFPEPTATARSQNRQPSFAADLLAVLPFPTLLLTPAGQIRDANPTITTLLGMARDELRGQSIFDAVDPTNHPTCDQLLRTACIESGSTQIGELAFIAPSGATLLMRCSILLVPQVSPPQLLMIGQPLQEWLSLLQEVIDLNSELEIRNVQLADLNKQLQQAEQQREHVTNMLVHDIRGPLVATRAGLEIAQRGLNQAHSPSLIQEAINAGLRSLHSVIELTNDLLDMKKFADGHRPRDIESISIATLCNEVQASVHALSIQQQVHIDIAVPQDLLATGERRLLRRVLQNVIVNAIRFTPAGESISVTAQADGEKHILLAIADRGPGVAAEDRERIFLPFVQGAGEGKRGSGLGLAFCREVLHAHGGRIWVEERRGGGSRFCLTLPY